MKDREEEMVALVRGKIISLADMLTDRESDACRAIGGKYDEIAEKLEADTLWKERLNRFVAAQVEKSLDGRGKALFDSLWNGKQEELAAYAADGVLALADAMLQDEKSGGPSMPFFSTLSFPMWGSSMTWWGRWSKRSWTTTTEEPWRNWRKREPGKMWP